MPMLARWRARWRAVVERETLDRDLDRELSEWVAELAARHEAAGVSPAEARRRALAETGGVEQVKERVRDIRSSGRASGLLQDVWYACRSLARAPGLFAAVVLTLALGIGPSAAVYSIVHAILLKDPPYRAPGRLTMLWANMGAAGMPRTRLAGPEVVEFRREARALAAVAAIQPASAAITEDGAPEQIALAKITPDFLDVLGIDLAEGRSFVVADGFPTAAPPVVISWSLFERRMGANPNALGRRIVLDGAPVEVIGVLRPDFRLRHLDIVGFPNEPQIYQPFAADLARGNRLIRPYFVVARLAGGASAETAAAEVAGISADLARQHPVYRDARHTFYLSPLLTEGRRAVRPMLLALFAGVMVVLAVACVNVSGLLLARAAGRRREMATLIALGASRVRLARQFVVEGLITAAIGAGAGVIAGLGVLRAIAAFAPPGLERLEDVRIDGSVLAITATVACGWGLACALVPLAECRRLNPAAALGASGRVVGRLRYRSRSNLVVAQIALGTVLVVAATLLVRTTNALYRVDAGFDVNVRALTFRLAWPSTRYPSGAEANAFSRDLELRLLGRPGVEQVGTISQLPFDTTPATSGKYVTEAEDTPSGQASARFASMRVVSPATLPMLGVRLVAGRWFDESDDRNGPPVSIVDETLAARAWPGQPAVGQRLRLPIELDRQVAAVWTTVVGVVGHARFRTLDADGPEQAYISARQTHRQGPTTYVVTTALDPAQLSADVPRVVAEIDPLLPTYDIRPYHTYVARGTATRRFTSVLTSSFAFLTLALAAIGLVALVSYSVASRRREFGVRLALGATGGTLQRMVLAEATTLVGAGIGIGLVIALAASNALRALLFNVSPTDVASYAGSTLLLVLVGIAASWWPARRAAGVNPADALRAE